MNEEHLKKFIKAKQQPISSMYDLNKRLIGTRDGFIYYTSNFRLDFENKMYRLGQFESNWKELKKYLQEDDWASINGEIAVKLIYSKMQELESKDKWNCMK